MPSEVQLRLCRFAGAGPQVPMNPGMMPPGNPDLGHMLGGAQGGGPSASQVLQLVQLMSNPQVAAALGVGSAAPVQAPAPGPSLNLPPPSVRRGARSQCSP